jgi:hypothetical protein
LEHRRLGNHAESAVAKHEVKIAVVFAAGKSDRCSDAIDVPLKRKPS